ncbi:MAG: hypothetical protein PVG78_05410 [Desulfobacterales bacterium]|jgi:hypothetical protein
MIQVVSHANAEETAAPDRRKTPRREIAAAVIFGCFNTSGAQRFFAGSMQDCTEDGMRIESDAGFRKGTILLIRMLSCPFHLLAPEISESLRTVMLAEVKWRQTLQDEMGTRYRMGVRCL